MGERAGSAAAAAVAWLAATATEAVGKVEETAEEVRVEETAEEVRVEETAEEVTRCNHKRSCTTLHL